MQAFAQEPSAPSARSGYAMAYDAGRAVVVLFGGQDSAGTRLSDTWEWSYGKWTRIAVQGPGARINASAGYETYQKAVFLFGGSTDSGAQSDLWTYDGKSWTKMTPAISPPARQLGLMAFDKAKQEFVLFGGMSATRQPLGDTWILKAGEWKQSMATGPSPRASACMAYQDDLASVFMYGGYVNDHAINELWSWKNGVWKNLTTPAGPPRIHASLSYDQTRSRMLLFGGFNDSVRTNELWEYADQQWSEILSRDNNIPSPRAEHRSVYVPGYGLFIFGGVIGPDPNTRRRGQDTWIYNAKKWTRFNLPVFH